MYKNAIASLDAAVHTLCTLSCLSDLDLGGSPCSLVPEYKHRLVLELPSLATLDGDSLTDLDRWAAVNFENFDRYWNLESRLGTDRISELD